MSHPTWENRATPNFSEHFATPCNIAHNSCMESAVPKCPSTIIPPVRHGRNVFTSYAFIALVRLWAPSRHSFIEDFALRCQLEVVVVLNSKPPFNEASYLVRYYLDVYFHGHSLLKGKRVCVMVNLSVNEQRCRS